MQVKEEPVVTLTANSSTNECWRCDASNFRAHTLTVVKARILPIITTVQKKPPGDTLKFKAETPDARNCHF